MGRASGDTACSVQAEARSTGKERLSGGLATQGVVRVGDTVRRPRQASSPFVAELLRVLDAAGFRGAPRYLGSDTQGREVFSYIPGDVPRHVRPFTDEQVSAAACLVRGFHDATRGTALAGEQEVVCHNDLNVRNVVLQDDVPVAWLDFDMAAPGEAITDVATLAWGWCISSWPPPRPVSEQGRQLRVLVDAYGVSDPQRRRLLDAIVGQQRRLVAVAEARIAAGADERIWTGVRDWAEGDLRFTLANAETLRPALYT